MRLSQVGFLFFTILTIVSFAQSLGMMSYYNQLRYYAFIPQ